MDTTSSSKVTIEYHDPDGVFALISRDITSRLPLRNLQWHSQNRPVRQIPSLHLDLVPDSTSGPRPGSQHSEFDFQNSFDIVRNVSDQRKPAVKERRHQIPGLETSPYLKVYVLRCDDKPTYKQFERQKLRDWIKENAASKSKGKGGNHDAFEWLILHVVVPDTLAASEPRWREAAARDSDELKERPKQGTKWPGKSTRTVFDKLRADFNESGKSGQDRVAQIRLLKDRVPADLIPTPAIAETIEETWDEREKAWTDLMNKFKALILASFDLRVKQYKADIAEQDARRVMPGFNFCTFFIHKEGLAKALESIGLVEDALVIYDELSLGLETVLRDIADGRAEGTATTFAPFTDDIIDRIISSKKTQPNGWDAHESTEIQTADTADAAEKDYRERIVRSNISVFDFFCYLFSRQRALILRTANAQAVRAIAGKEGSEDLVLVSEVCWRSMSFCHNIARRLRQDLLAHRYRQDTDRSLSHSDIDSLVFSWTYTFVGQVLEETRSIVTDQILERSTRGSPINGMSPSHRHSISAHPPRTASLPAHQSRVSHLRGRSSLQSASESDVTGRPSHDIPDPPRTIGAAPGLLELITYRAELVMMQRKMLERLAKQRGWLAGWTMVRDKTSINMENVDLNGSINVWHDEGEGRKDAKHQASNLLSPALVPALTSEHDFRRAFERLSGQAMRYFISSTQDKSVESIMGDLAILKYQQGDAVYAASYFEHVLPQYANEGWNLMEAEVLKMHAECLKNLDRKQDYIQTLLALLAKACGKLKARNAMHRRLELTEADTLEVRDILPNIVAFADHLDTELSIAAEPYFRDISLEPEVVHYPDKDGLLMHLCLCHVLDEELHLDRVSVRLLRVDDPNQELWLHDASPAALTPGSNTYVLHATATSCGAFLIDNIVLHVRKLRFEYRPQARPEQQDPLGIRDLDKSLSPTDSSKWVYLYPNKHAFNAEVSLAKVVHVDKPRDLEIDLGSGWNHITAIDVHLKPASAGLRLHLADAKLTGIDKRSQEELSPGLLELAGLGTSESARVSVPCSLEQSSQDIVIRLQVNYHTARGSFSFITSARLRTQLPLDVAVHDTFHLDNMFSKFSIRTTNGMPLVLAQPRLDSSAAYAVSAPPDQPPSMHVFEDKPINLIYRVTPKSDHQGVDRKQAALAFSMRYCIVEEALRNRVVASFVSDVEASPFTDLARLLVPVLSSRLASAWNASDVAMALLLNDAKVPSFDEVGWYEVTKTLSSSVQHDLTAWLRSWHGRKSGIDFAIDTADQEMWSRVLISVDVPTVDFVHKVSLSLPQPVQRFGQQLSTIALGKTIAAKLNVVYTRKWSSQAIFCELSDQSKEPASNSFVYDVQADADSWLIGGQRRGHFEAAEGQSSTFDLALTSLKPGRLRLPQVHLQASHTRAGSKADHGAALPSCETHYESGGHLVHVVHDVRTARVHIPETPGTEYHRSRPSTTGIVKEPG